MAIVKRTLLGGAIEHEEDDTSWDIRAFNDFGKNLALWHEYSRALHRAAVLTAGEKSSRHRITQLPIALMLGAYAIEMSLKMVIVATYVNTHGFEKQITKSDDILPKTHDLLKILTQAGLRTAKADREALSKLTPYAVWAGRYPIPMKANGYQGPAVFERFMNRDAKQGVPLWTVYVPLYQKIHRLAFRRVFGGLSTE